MCLAGLAAAVLWAAAEGRAATDVLVNNYDDSRTGANLSESILNVSNVKLETFGRLFSYSVDGAVLGQPLVVSGVRMPNRGLRDVVYDKADLQRSPSVFCTTCVSRVAAVSGVEYLDPDCTFLGPGGGIWQAGRGPVVDGKGMVYFFTGNKAHIIKNGA